MNLRPFGSRLVTLDGANDFVLIGAISFLGNCFTGNVPATACPHMRLAFYALIRRLAERPKKLVSLQ